MRATWGRWKSGSAMAPRAVLDRVMWSSLTTSQARATRGCEIGASTHLLISRSHIGLGALYAARAAPGYVPPELSSHPTLRRRKRIRTVGPPRRDNDVLLTISLDGVRRWGRASFPTARRTIRPKATERLSC